MGLDLVLPGSCFEGILKLLSHKFRPAFRGYSLKLQAIFRLAGLLSSSACWVPAPSAYFALQGRALLDDGDVGQVFGDRLQIVQCNLRVGDLPAAKRT
jgi:hypothetical protein